MKIKQLTLTDFGVFRGVNTFDLSPGEKPIILFGGKNGAGKTTVLESIRLCLYGARALGRRVKKRDYERHLIERIHRGRGTVGRARPPGRRASGDLCPLPRSHGVEAHRGGTTAG